MFTAMRVGAYAKNALARRRPGAAAMRGRWARWTGSGWARSAGRRCSGLGRPDRFARSRQGGRPDRGRSPLSWRRSRTSAPMATLIGDPRLPSRLRASPRHGPRSPGSAAAASTVPVPARAAGDARRPRDSGSTRTWHFASLHLDPAVTLTDLAVGLEASIFAIVLVRRAARCRRPPMGAMARHRWLVASFTATSRRRHHRRGPALSSFPRPATTRRVVDVSGASRSRSFLSVDYRRGDWPRPSRSPALAPG